MKQRAYLIAEKPSLLRAITAVYDRIKDTLPYEIDSIALHGHVMRLLLPDEIDDAMKTRSWDNLPFFPEDYDCGWQYTVIKEKKTGNFRTPQETFKEIQTALKKENYTYVIHACDADQEGQGIAVEILNGVGYKGKIMRFWVNSLTDEQIEKGLRELEDFDSPKHQNLYNAFLARQHSDYRYGMNLSAAGSLFMGKTVSIGRVKTPILTMICRREREIAGFTPKTSYGVALEYNPGTAFEGVLFNPKEVGEEEEDDTENSKEKKSGIVWYETKDEAQQLISTLAPASKVVSITRKHVQKYPDKLYKLATAQIDADRIYGYSAKQVQDAIQELYEKALLTYPRTDCEYISSDENLIEMISSNMATPEFAPFIKTITKSDIERVRNTKKWVNDKEVEKSSHTALVPTKHVPDLGALTEVQRNVYLMIVRRFISIFLKPQEADETVIVTENNGFSFRSSGKIITAPGYTALYGRDSSDTAAILPDVHDGDILQVTDRKIKEKTSKCPKRYTDGELIQVCENPLKMLEEEKYRHLGKELSIGTPATREGIIRQLIEKNKYMEYVKEGKSKRIKPTALGMALIDNLAGCDITKVDMTAEWEEKLQLIRSGELNLDDLEEAMMGNVEYQIAEMQKMQVVTPLPSGKKSYDHVCKCPVCGSDILAGDKGYFCSGWKKDGSGCNVRAPRMIMGTELTPEGLNELLNNNAVCSIDTAYGQVDIIYDEQTHNVVELTDQTSLSCPLCKNALLRENKARYICTECGFTARKQLAGYIIKPSDMRALGESGRIGPVDMLSAKGRQFKSFLVVDAEKKGIGFRSPDEDLRGESAQTALQCPGCKKKSLFADSLYYFCECGIKFKKSLSGYTFTEEDINDMRTERQTKVRSLYSERKGKNFDAYFEFHPKKGYQCLEMKFPKKEK